MDLKPDEVIWCPSEDDLSYLIILKKTAHPPKDREIYLFYQVDLYNRLLEESSEQEKDGAQEVLELWFPWSVLGALNHRDVRHPKFPSELMHGVTMSEDENIDLWKRELDNLFPCPESKVSQEEGILYLKDLSLESWLGQLA